MFALPRFRVSSLCAAILLAEVSVWPAIADTLTPLPDAMSLLLQQGEGALANEEYAVACARFTEILGLDWNHPRAYGLLQQARGERLRAMRRWEAAARLAESQHDLSKADALYRRILSEDSTRVDLRARLDRPTARQLAATFVRAGVDKFMVDDFAGAELDFLQALAHDPTDSLANRYLERARQKSAASGSLAAIQSDPESWSRYLEALHKLRDGDLITAERLWRELLTRYPANESILSNLEQVRRRLGHEGAVAGDQ